MVDLQIVDRLTVNEPGRPPVSVPTAPLKPERAVRLAMTATHRLTASPKHATGTGVMLALTQEAGQRGLGADEPTQGP